ncbi:transketolase [Terasakiella sp. SH-1]|uniref:transketolase n=1 Tax=Terasakiella sp. SH-1 TaxID=2560057 RepID=UPI0010730FF1|nr:transketolase [Terasakiella sp. SH-1]
MSEQKQHELSNVSLKERARRIRINGLRILETPGKGYIGQTLAMADWLAVVYFYALNYKVNDLEWDGRDRFFLSPGHLGCAQYGALIEAGVLPEDEIGTYGLDDSRFPISAQPAYTPGIEISGGSLGHGLGIAVGSAISMRRQKKDSFVYCVVSDGEMNEGSTWEAAMIAGTQKLSNIIGILDNNNMQNDGPSREVSDPEPMFEKWEAFGWSVQRIDGNDLDALCEAFDNARNSTVDKPRMIICDTQMGKGVSFIEHREKQTHMTAWTPDDFAKAYEELGYRSE